MDNQQSPIVEAFNQGMDAWKDNQQAPWGRLRYSIIQENLRPHLGQAPQQIIDGGGGNGVESILLAQQGHYVTLVDFSTEMLAEAQRSAVEHQVEMRVKFHQGDVSELLQIFPANSFDVALFHNVIQYTSDPQAALDSIFASLRPQGLLSLCTINPHSEVYIHALRELDITTALDRVEAKTKNANLFGLEHKLFAAEELIQMLSTAGFKFVTQYGVRCICDYIANNEIKTEPEFFAQLEKLEMTLRNKYPYYLLARIYQLIVQKEP